MKIVINSHTNITGTTKVPASINCIIIITKNIFSLAGYYTTAYYMEISRYAQQEAYTPYNIQQVLFLIKTT